VKLGRRGGKSRRIRFHFVRKPFCLWPSKSAISKKALFQRHVKETLSNDVRRCLAKLNTLPDTFWHFRLMATPLVDMLAEDSCLDRPAPLFYCLAVLVSYRTTPFHSKPVNRNSSAKVVSPFKRQE